MVSSFRLHSPMAMIEIAFPAIRKSGLLQSATLVD